MRHLRGSRILATLLFWVNSDISISGTSQHTPDNVRSFKCDGAQKKSNCFAIEYILAKNDLVVSPRQFPTWIQFWLTWRHTLMLPSSYKLIDVHAVVAISYIISENWGLNIKCHHILSKSFKNFPSQIWLVSRQHISNLQSLWAGSLLLGHPFLEVMPAIITRCCTPTSTLGQQLEAGAINPCSFFVGGVQVD